MEVRSSYPGPSAESIREIREAIKLVRAMLRDLSQPDASRYWRDFLFRVGAGWGAVALAIASPFWLAVPLILVAACTLYGALSFTHEISHLRRGTLPGFRLVWNLLVGIPLLAPTFLYEKPHLAHHKSASYGTAGDGEYDDFRGRPEKAFFFLATSFFLPLFAAVRFAIIGPVSFLNRRLRSLVVTRMSSMGIVMDVQREPPQSGESGQWIVLEIATGLGVWVGVGMVASGVLPLRAVGVWYATFVLAALINGVRAVGATHHYMRVEGGSFEEQILDSVNVHNDSWLQKLLCPVGLRFHALHHMAPSLPYHALEAAHERLLALLPETNAYRALSIPSVGVGFVRVVTSDSGSKPRGGSERPTGPVVTSSAA